MSQCTHVWVMSHMDGWVMFQFKKKNCNYYHDDILRANKWVALNIDDSNLVRTSHITGMNESRHIYKWVTSHVWMSHGTHIHESPHVYEWVTSHIYVSHVTRMNESRHVTYMNESRHTYKWVTSRVWMSHVTPKCFTSLVNNSCLIPISHVTFNCHRGGVDPYDTLSHKSSSFPAN